MAKLIKINDRKPMEIYIGRKTRGPIPGIRLEDNVIGRLLKSIDPPRDMYAIGPDKQLVKLTLQNYTKTEEELFGLNKTVNDEEDKSNFIESKKQEELKRSLEAIKHQESKDDYTKSETNKADNTEETKVEDNKPEVSIPEETVDTSTESTVIAETDDSVHDVATEDTVSGDVDSTEEKIITSGYINTNPEATVPEATTVSNNKDNVNTYNPNKKNKNKYANV